MTPNYDLFRRVREAVLAEPYRVDMRTGLNDRECGTVGCIAGWACVLNAEHPMSTPISQFAAFMGWHLTLDQRLLIWQDISSHAAKVFGAEFPLIKPLFFVGTGDFPHIVESPLKNRLWPIHKALQAQFPGTPAYAALVAAAIDTTVALLQESFPEVHVGQEIPTTTRALDV